MSAFKDSQRRGSGAVHTCDLNTDVRPSVPVCRPVGRAMELGRECLEIWGYKRVDELIWVKVSSKPRRGLDDDTGTGITTEEGLNLGLNFCFVSKLRIKHPLGPEALCFPPPAD